MSKVKTQERLRKSEDEKEIARFQEVKHPSRYPPGVAGKLGFIQVGDNFPFSVYFLSFFLI